MDFFFLKEVKLQRRRIGPIVNLNECPNIAIITAFLIKSEIFLKDYRLNFISNLCKDNLLSGRCHFKRNYFCT